MQQIVDGSGVRQESRRLLIEGHGARFIATGGAGSYENDFVLKKFGRVFLYFSRALLRINGADHSPDRQARIDERSAMLSRWL